ncbi:transporter substrate-binding domain-containing protein [Methylococcus sp. EFPC2]|uniref:transporter substrate-binding domain-containing protein n=1 Tax=Methylococcus sp. EFPC2 TaxID=2812648 RepID=UPI00196880A7|nr:transporter substrate-binding domain-containing protein [Methylococcus sp. EFPC2]QSA98802.1 transporter substrate-binding domain-containing protein [Methylococcus sp. EFPC2]
MLKIAIIVASLVLLASCSTTSQIAASGRSGLAPSGKLRVGINIGNMLLTAKDPVSGQYGGIAFDLARELGRWAGVPIEIVTFDSAGKLADGVRAGAWDVAFLGIEPERAEGISFSPAYAEIESTYLVPAGSPLHTVTDVDRDGVRIAISARSAYDLVLSRTLRRARLERVPGVEGVPGTEGAYRLFIEEHLDALAGLKPVLMAFADKLPGSRILDGHISTVQQAIGVPKDRAASVQLLREFVEDIKANGLVARAIEKNGVRGVSVAPRTTLQ